MEQKNKFKKFVITLIILIVLVIGLYLFADWFSKTTGYAIGNSKNTKIAKCLSEKGVEFYGSGFCTECEEQKEMWMGAFQYISYIDCGKEKELCPNIREIPAWYINKEIHYGSKSFDELQELAGCQ